LSSDPPEPRNVDPPPELGGLVVRAATVLRIRQVWIVPLVMAILLAAAMSALYVGSVVNPAGHLHGLPVLVVNEDTGVAVHAQPVDIGGDITTALRGAAPINSRLKLTYVSLAQARAEMDRAGAFAALVIPSALTRSVLQAAGVSTPGKAPPANADVTLEENLRLGSLGVSLASAVLTPALAKISATIGAHLTSASTPAARRNPVLAARIADPVTLTTAQYRPLPDHTALGLSAFYIALLALIGGFVLGTLSNQSADAALGYAATQLGPRYAQRRPVAINHRQSFLVKWAVGSVAAPLLSGMILLVSAVGLGMRAPDWLLLWTVLALACLMVMTGTLALLATFGQIGQLLAMILLVYLSLASSGGTVPIQALPGIFQTIGHLEPLRNTLAGTRAILYFDARGDAGLTHSFVVLALEFVFWAIFGLGFTSWYDHRKLDRLSPDLILAINRRTDQIVAERSEASSDGPEAAGSDIPSSGGMPTDSSFSP
jgi:YhgE/Pip-like protein